MVNAEAAIGGRKCIQRCVINDLTAKVHHRLVGLNVSFCKKAEAFYG
jgi:hypothetical protein